MSTISSTDVSDKPGLISIYTLARWALHGVLCIYGWERSNALHSPTTSQTVTTPLDGSPFLLHNRHMTKTPMTSSTQVDVDAIMRDELFITPYTDACYDEADVVETFDDLYGDDYADAMMKELGF